MALTVAHNEDRAVNAVRVQLDDGATDNGDNRLFGRVGGIGDFVEMLAVFTKRMPIMPGIDNQLGSFTVKTCGAVRSFP